MNYYELKRKQTLERLREKSSKEMQEPEIRNIVQTQFVKVDENGEFVEPVLIEHYEGEQPEETAELVKPPEEDKVLFKPKFDKVNKQWIESLSETDLNKRIAEIAKYARDPNGGPSPLFALFKSRRKHFKVSESVLQKAVDLGYITADEKNQIIQEIGR